MASKARKRKVVFALNDCKVTWVQEFNSFRVEVACRDWTESEYLGQKGSLAEGEREAVEQKLLKELTKQLLDRHRRLDLILSKKTFHSLCDVEVRTVKTERPFQVKAPPLDNPAPYISIFLTLSCPGISKTETVEIRFGEDSVPFTEFQDPSQYINLPGMSPNMLTLAYNKAYENLSRQALRERDKLSDALFNQRDSDFDGPV